MNLIDQCIAYNIQINYKMHCIFAIVQTQLHAQLQPGKRDDGAKIPEHVPLTHYQAWGAVMAVVRRVVPRTAWGSTHNLGRIKETARHVTLLGRHDAFFLGHVMQGWKLTDCRCSAGVFIL